MKFSTLNSDTLIQNLKACVTKEKEITLTILHGLKEVERRKLELSRGHASLYKFCLHELGYSEAEALSRIRAMRLLNTMPEIEEKIQSGTLSLSNAAEVQNQFRRENERRRKLSLMPLAAADKQKVISKIEKASTRDCQRTLAGVYPEIQTQVQEKTKVLADEKTMIQFSASKDLVTKLEKLKGLLAHKNYSGSYESLFEELAEIALRKLDPLQKDSAPRKTTKVGVEKVESFKRERSSPKETTEINAGLPMAPKVSNSQIAGTQTSRYVPAPLRRAVWKKANGKCEFSNPVTGIRCESMHALEVDHIEEFSRGGKSTEASLRLLCDVHNRHRSSKAFKQQEFQL